VVSLNLAHPVHLVLHTPSGACHKTATINVQHHEKFNFF